MAKSEQEILEGLAEIVNEETGIPAGDVKPEKSFTDDLDIDSLSMMTIVVNAEEKFGVRIPDDDVKGLSTVGDAVSYIQKASASPTRSLVPRDPAGAPKGSEGMTDSRLSDSQRVVVTGLGATTPLGGDVASTWSGMLAGQSGVEVLTADWVEMLPVHIAAPVAVEPSEVLPVPQIKRMDRSGQFALIAAREAWADAGSPEIEPERKGVVIASGIGGVTTLLAAYDTLKERGARRVLPMTVPMLMPNGPAAVVGLELTARAGVHTPVSACSSGAEAIAYAVDMIRSGRADVVAAGGTEAAIHVLPLAGFAAMQALSTRNDEPERASRPYDKGRDGFVLGEGAGVVILETLEHARARGARIYGEVAGDRHHVRRPPHGPARPGRCRCGPRDDDGGLRRRRHARRRHPHQRPRDIDSGR